MKVFIKATNLSSEYSLLTSFYRSANLRDISIKNEYRGACRQQQGQKHGSCLPKLEMHLRIPRMRLRPVPTQPTSDSAGYDRETSARPSTQTRIKPQLAAQRSFTGRLRKAQTSLTYRRRREHIARHQKESSIQTQTSEKRQLERNGTVRISKADGVIGTTEELSTSFRAAVAERASAADRTFTIEATPVAETTPVIGSTLEQRSRPGDESSLGIEGEGARVSPVAERTIVGDVKIPSEELPPTSSTGNPVIADSTPSAASMAPIVSTPLVERKPPAESAPSEESTPPATSAQSVERPQPAERIQSAVSIPSMGSITPVEGIPLVESTPLAESTLLAENTLPVESTPLAESTPEESKPEDSWPEDSEPEDSRPGNSTPAPRESVLLTQKEARAENITVAETRTAVDVPEAEAEDESGSNSSFLKNTTPHTSSHDTLTLASTTSHTRVAKINEYDFEIKVLNPRGIRIDDQTKSTSPFYHFNTDAAPMVGTREYYRNIEGLEATTVWLEGEEQLTKNVLREYDSMEAFKLCEAEFSLYATENLLKREIRNPRLPEVKCWMTERMVEFTARPTKKLWEQPPIIKEAMPHKAYNFDIRPDCSYWISLQGFRPEHRKVVKEHVAVQQNRIMCPYLTVEFKKDCATIRQARNQVAVSSALSLYNRWKLKDQYLRAACQPWHPSYVKVLRHYGLTFTGRAYEIWCTEADLDFDAGGAWAGCRMFRLCKDACNTTTGIREFANWINEIHRWGLTVHGPDCEMDVTRCISPMLEAKQMMFPIWPESELESEDDESGDDESGDDESEDDESEDSEAFTLV